MRPFRYCATAAGPAGPGRGVFPAEKSDLLERFDIAEIIDLANYLMYGFGDSEPETEENNKKKAISNRNQRKR